jgi:hydroxymethylbilane synthase
VDATLLALAGLKRLGMHSLVHQSSVLSWDEMLPAVAQGAIGIQCRENDLRALKYLSALNDPDTKAAVDCERAFLESLDGNCRTPIAGQAKVIGNELVFKGMILMGDGSESISVERRGPVSRSREVGRQAGEEILSRIGPEKFRQYQESFT